MKTRFVLIAIVVMMAVSACGGKSAQAPEMPAAPVESQPEVQEPVVVEEPAAAAEAPAQEVQQPEAPATGGGAYTSPQGLFTLEMPAGWAYAQDTQVIDETVVDTYTAPDGNAFVQVVVHESGINVSNVEKGQITLDFMKRLYGSDLRVAKDVTMDDGREMLEWWSDDNGTSGTTYFDRIQEYMYFYTTAYKDDFENDYQNVLEDVRDSFSIE